VSSAHSAILVLSSVSHRCSAELVALVAATGLSLGEGAPDLLCSVGDVIGKGPFSLACVDLLRHWRAVVVCGNHEVKFRAHCESRTTRVTRDPEAVLGRSLEEWHSAKRSSFDSSRAVRLPPDTPSEHIEWIFSLPTLRRIKWPGTSDTVVSLLHAGVPPVFESAAAALAHPRGGQDALCWLRTVQTKHTLDELPADPDSMFRAKHDASLTKSGWRPWARVWRGELCVFGHDSSLQLQLCPRALGLDTGCAKGTFLTAVELIPPEESRHGSLVCVLYAVQAHRNYTQRGHHGPTPEPRRDLGPVAPAVEMPFLHSIDTLQEQLEGLKGTWETLRVERTTIPLAVEAATATSHAAEWLETWPDKAGAVTAESTGVPVLRAHMRWNVS
jgi:hypothetical protein